MFGIFDCVPWSTNQTFPYFQFTLNHGKYSVAYTSDLIYINIMVINLWDIYLLNENNIDNTFLYVKLEAISESVVLFICNEIKVLHNNRFVMLAQKKV